MITITGVSKTFTTKNNSFEALKNVSLTINENSIHGVIGPSGAGKSTLVRLINQLEVHEQGTIKVFDYNELRKLNKESTRMYRQDVSMIFQNFNLLNRKTVFDNIALPLRFQRRLSSDDLSKVQELVELVGLKGYEESYPEQLSGGQRQRVGIARALVNNPKILLCDEPTSALDTLTIRNILSLIKSIKEKLKLTVIIVTHDMNVIKDVCDFVTVMDSGLIVENNSIDNIIFNPQNDITKSLLDTVGFNIEELIMKFSSKEHKYLLRFNESQKQSSIISSISISTNIDINILYANITPHDQGIMLINIETSNEEKLQEVLTNLTNRGVVIRNV